jgi:glyoxylase-like metal-dependent hydrolase (beta-lactamase superfamily II)
LARLSILKVRGDRDVNSYVVSCADTTEAVVIDPIEPADKLLEQLRDLKVRWVVGTHGHPGHVAGRDAVVQATGAASGLHMDDAKTFLRSADR